MATPNAFVSKIPAKVPHSLWPWVGLLVGVFLSIVFWWTVQREEHTRIKDLQTLQATAMVGQLESRMRAMEEVLRGAAGYLGRGPLPAREEWQAYVEGLNLQHIYPGIQGLGFAEWIPRNAMASHLQRLRQEGFPDYQVVPGGPLAPDPEGASSIIYLEPMDARNQRAFGKDMFAEALRREAMLRARDTGQLSLSAPVTLYQESQIEVQVGTLLYAPVYTIGMPVATVAQRRLALRGWAYYPLRMADLIRAAVSRDLGLVDLKMYDGVKGTPEALLFDSVVPSGSSDEQGTLVRTLEVGGRTWTIHLHPNPVFLAAVGHASHWELLAGGLVMSLLLFTVLTTILGAEDRARKLAHQRGEELLATEAKYQALFESAPIGMAIVDSLTGCFLSVNPRLGEILGYPAVEILGRGFQQFTHPDHLAADLATTQQLATGVISEVHKEKRYIHRDGHHVWGRLSMVRLPGQPGDALRHLSLVEDITHARRQQAELQASDEQFRSLFEKNLAVKLIIDPTDGHLVEVNPAAVAFYGYERDELLGLRIYDLNCASDGEVKAEMARARQEERRQFQFTHRLASGELRKVEVYSSPIDWKGVPCLVSIVHDMTARDEAETALRQSESRLRMLSDQLPDSFIYQYEVRPGERPQFHYLSSGVERLCGVSSEAVMRDAMVLLGQMDPDLLPAYLEREAASGREGSPFLMDLRQRRPDGSWRWFRVRSMPRLQPNGAVVWEGISTDITDQKLIQVALEESEIRFRTMADSAPALIWMSGTDQLCFWFNQVWLDWTGRTMEQEMGHGWAEGVHPEDLPKCLEIYVGSFEAREPFEMEYRLRHRSGNYRWILDRGTPRLSSEGDFLGYIGACIDIQDRKEALEAVLDSEARFRSVVEGSPLPIFLHREGRFVYLNPAGLHLLGATRAEDLVGQPVMDRIHPDNRALVQDRVAEAMASGEAKPSIEERLMTLDGTVIDVEVQGRPILYEGQPTVLVFAQDITERRRALAAVQESESRFRTLADTAPVLIWMSGPDKRCTHFNQGWTGWTGRTIEQSLGQGWAEGLHPDDLLAAMGTYNRCFEAREPFVMEFRLRHRDGTYRWISDRGAPRFTEDGAFLGFIGAGIDIQDAKDAEVAIREIELRARKAESLVLMAGGIAHDFNNLFQALQGNLELAELKARQYDAVVQPLERAKSILLKAVNLSWKMLDFSGHFFLNMKSLDLGAWLQASCLKWQAELPANLRLDLTSDPVPLIQADETKLEQVLKAVVDNAREAMGSEEGQIRLRLFVDFGTDRPGTDTPGLWPVGRPDLPATVCLEIADDGPGVPDDKLGLICDPFFTTRQAGRGLGLSATAGILQAHRAGLHLLNSPGQGLVLRLHFPPSGT